MGNASSQERSYAISLAPSFIDVYARIHSDEKEFIQGLQGLPASNDVQPAPSQVNGTRFNICGITRVSDGQADATMIGLIFAPSPGRITIEAAKTIAEAI